MGRLTDARAHVTRVVKLAGDKPVIVMLSGGKDSVIVLHLVREQLPAERVVCVHMGMTKGLRHIEDVLDVVCKRYGVAWHFFPHVLATAFLRDARFRRPNLRGVQAKKLLVYRNIENYAREQLGAEWVLTGQRKNDSLERRGMMKAWGIVDEKHLRAHPIADWSARQASAFVLQHHLPTVPWLGKKRRNSSGLDFTPDVLSELRERYPSDYAKLVEAFPYIGSIIAREELFGA